MIPAPVVDEDRLLVQPVRLHVVRQRVPHALHHIDCARLRPRLRQWDEVCDRRADIRRDHVRAHALLGLPHEVIDFLRDMLFNPSVRTGSLSCQYVRVLRQPRCHVRHSRPPILRKLIDQLLLLVRVKRVICLDRVHLPPDAFVARAVADLRLQCPHALHILRVEDHVARRIQIQIKSLDRIVRRRVAQPFVGILEIPDARPESGRQPVDRRRQR